MVYIIGVFAAIAIPAYQDYTVRAQLMGAYMSTHDARQALAKYYESKKQIPESLSAVGISTQTSNGTQLTLESRGMVFTVATPRGSLVFTPSLDDDDRITWKCTAAGRLRAAQLPPECRVVEQP
jgi:Tfp pilus assembly major pilin PilA